MSEESVSISQFTSTAESGDVPDANHVGDNLRESWAEITPEVDIPVPDVLRNLASNGLRFRSVPFESARDKSRLVKNRSVYFAVDTVVTSQTILEAFDAAGVDIDEITSIQRKASNKTWIVTFDSQLAKEAALEVACVEIGGSTIFLGDCENRLVLVKLYEAPAELPDTALIGRLNHYGRVLSFRRDKIAQFIDNGVRTARMSLCRHIPSTINLAGEFIRVWYPSQPKTCRNCGSEDHLVKDCSSVRCFNCERPGHRAENCEEPAKCTVCKADDHQLADCPFVLYSANVDSGLKEGAEKTEDEKQKEKQQFRVRMEQARNKQQETENQQGRMQIEGGSSHEARQEKDKGREKNKGKEQRGEGKRGEKVRDSRERHDKHRHESEKSEDERDREDRRRYESSKEGRRRDREDSDHHRDREYSRRDYKRDRSSRRDHSDYDDDDDHAGWTRVSYRRRRRYDYF